MASFPPWQLLPLEKRKVSESLAAGPDQVGHCAATGEPATQGPSQNEKALAAIAGSGLVEEHQVSLSAATQSTCATGIDRQASIRQPPAVATPAAPRSCGTGGDQVQAIQPPADRPAVANLPEPVPPPAVTASTVPSGEEGSRKSRAAGRAPAPSQLKALNKSKLDRVRGDGKKKTNLRSEMLWVYEHMDYKESDLPDPPSTGALAMWRTANSTAKERVAFMKTVIGRCVPIRAEGTKSEAEEAAEVQNGKFLDIVDGFLQEMRA